MLCWCGERVFPERMEAGRDEFFEVEVGREYERGRGGVVGENCSAVVTGVEVSGGRLAASRGRARGAGPTVRQRQRCGERCRDEPDRGGTSGERSKHTSSTQQSCDRNGAEWEGHQSVAVVPHAVRCALRDPNR